MTLKQASGMLGLAALAAFSAPSALAQDSGWYLGANVGRSGTTIDDARIRSGLLGQALGTVSIVDRDRDTGYKVFGGWQVNRNIGVEAGYFNLGHFGYTANTTPPGTLNGDIRLRGLNLDLVGTLPLFGRLSALGRVGVTSIQARDAFSATGAASVPYASANPSQRSTELKLGLGLSYAFTDSLSMRAEMERYRLRDAVGNRGHADLYSIGLVYRFGVNAQPVRAATPAPVPVTMVAPAPPPPPVAPRPAPPPPAVFVPPPPPPPEAPPPLPPRQGRN